MLSVSERVFIGDEEYRAVYPPREVVLGGGLET
jgi:hypothetical protein